PAVVLDATASVGMIASADGQQTDLALVPATGPPRILQSQSVSDGGSFDGITATADRIYWMHTLADTDGQAKTSLWTASRSGGPDGSDRRVVGRATDAAIASDVALCDRFEVLLTTATTSGQVAVSRLALYDIAGKRLVQVEAAATNAGARGDFLWWSTGDNET